MTALELPQSFGYQQTLMYGQYSKDLAEETRLEIEKLKKQKELDRLSGLAAIAAAEDVAPPIGYTKDSPFMNKILKKVNAWLLATRDFLFAYVVSEDWFFLSLLGLIMALLAFVIDYAIVMCAYAHKWLFEELNFSPILQYVAWVLFTIVFILFSTGFVHIVSPNAIGSGIPEMKTILRGVILKEYLSFRTGVSKVVGLIAALGSGLPFGKEGPFVHISSIIATLLGRLAQAKGIYENESRQTEMLAAACAVGVACSFSAPIGGVLFSIEVTATLFAVTNYWRGFFAAVWSALMFRLLKIMGASTNITALFQTAFTMEYAYHPYEILAFVFLGIISGLGGALFVNCHRRFVLFIRGQRTLNKFLQRNRFIYPFLVALLVSSLSCPVTIGKYMAGGLSQKTAIQQLFSNFTWTGDSSHPNVVEVAILNNWRASEESIDYEIFVTLLVFLLMNFWMGVVCITLPVPAGSFIPVFVLGAAMGRIVGEAMASVFPVGFHADHWVIPGGYAVVGAAAFSGAATHTISTTVIVCELTGQINHILPLTCAVLLANFVAKSIETNIFDSIIRIKKLPFLPHITTTNSATFNIFVDDFMIKDIFYITYTSSTYGEIKKLLSSTKLRAYPLVDSHQHMILLGSVQRAELQLLLEAQIGPERRLLPPDDGSEQNSATASPARMRRNRSSNSVLDATIPNIGGLEQVKEQLRALGYSMDQKWKAGDPAPLSAPPTVRGLPSFDAKPGKSILKRNQLEESTEEEAPTFFLSSDEDAAVQSPATIRKSALKKYNPYHTFSGVPSNDQVRAPSSAAKPSNFISSTQTIGNDGAKESNKSNPLTSLFRPPGDSPQLGIRGSVSSLIKGFANRYGNQSPSNSTTHLSPPIVRAPRKAVRDLSEADQLRWEERQLLKMVEYHGCVIDPAPFQLVAHTSLHKVHSLFSLLALKQAYVTNIGRLVGVVSLAELRQCIEGTLSGKLVPKPMVPVGGDEEDPVTMTEYDDDDSHHGGDDDGDGSGYEGSDDGNGLPMGPTKYKFGPDRVADIDQLRQIANAAAAMNAPDKNSLPMPPPTSPKLKKPTLEPLKDPNRVSTEDKMLSIFTKPALPDISSSSKKDQPAERTTSESSPSPLPAPMTSPTVMVTPVTPPTAVIVDGDPISNANPPPSTVANPPARVGSRFRRFVVDETKLPPSKSDDETSTTVVHVLQPLKEEKSWSSSSSVNDGVDGRVDKAAEEKDGASNV